MTTITQTYRKPFLTRKMFFGITPSHLLLVGLMLLSLGLHLANLQAIGDANTYYSAAVESMLDSRENFFFVAAEPGGSVTVDKPPLGLWIEAAFAFLFGVSGVTVSLPNIIAGVLSVPVLVHMVKQHWGEGAGLIAGLALAVTPVAVATNRNNTMDGMLVFTLLLAAWCFIKAARIGKLRWLFLGAFLVGLGFNIKMLQAFLPLPAFYALYFFGAKTGWLRKLSNLGLATILLLVVSLSWAVIVDLTPADQRPYIGSSDNNTVMELILGHNGLSRLFNQRAGKGVSDRGAIPGSGLDAGTPPPFNPLSSGNQPPADGLPQDVQKPPLPGNASGPQPSTGTRPLGGALGDGPNASPDAGLNAGSTPFSQETGSPGIARFFSVPLSKQMSWLLPFGLLGLGLMLLSGRLCIPLRTEHQALVLWGGWLLTCLVFFSSVEGIFHAYYVIMLAPALSAVVGAGFVQLWRYGLQRRWLDGLLLVGVGATVAFQINSAQQYGVQGFAWIVLPLFLLAGGTVLLLIKQVRSMAYLAMLAALMFIPLIWTVLTVLQDSPNVNLPTAYEALAVDPSGVQRRATAPDPGPAEGRLIRFLQKNTQDVDYLLAVPNAHIGAPLVLETGRPVLYMGGFGGGDPVIDAAGLAEMVASGELRFVLLNGINGNQQEIAGWLASSCRVVPQFTSPPPGAVQDGQRPVAGRMNPGDQGARLFACGP